MKPSQSSIALFFILAALTSAVLGYPSRDPELGCDSDTPEHDGVAAENSTGPFSLKLSRYGALRAGDKLRVTIESESKAYKISDFLLQARTVPEGRRVGMFRVSEDVQTLNCGNMKNSAATRKKHNPVKDRSSITVTWVAPEDLKEDEVVWFSGNIGDKEHTFWAALKSDT